ncbi:MAG TPA: efflux RND transporter periplasmic adaptor subunit [Steroidobacteraceae bacterium]|nr:efflux RND transporter periplasmic adaptor subunit [Steroidobacteraceae bacterium]
MPPDPDKRQLLEQLRIDPVHRDEQTTSSRTLWITAGVVVAVLLVGAAVAYFVLRGPRFEVEAAGAAAPTSSAGPTAILQATGYVTARRQATVSAQITGALKEVLIEEGERVTAGQVLARVDDTAQRAALAQSVAQVEVAKAVLVQEQTQLEQARRDLKRNADLIDRHLVSQQALETADTAVRTQEALVASQVRQVELSVAAQRGAQVQLDYTTVRAPFSGVVTAKAAQAGEIVSPISAGGGFTRTGVGTIVDMDSLEIEVDVNEAYINRVRPNQPAEAVLDAYPDWTIPAHVIAIIPTADRSKATVKVRIAIDLKDPRILPDMGVRVSFLEEAAKSADAATSGSQSPAGPRGLLVPSGAIVERDGRSMVFTIEGDHAHAIPVTPGQTYGDLRQVEGLPSGARVVKAPPAEMTDGARIVVNKQ